MALGSLVPWIVPPDYVGAMRAGTDAGLHARSLDIQQSEAGDRLRMAYDQLAAQERRAHEALQVHQQQAQAAMALRAQQNDALNTYRQQNAQRLSQQFGLREDRLSDQFGSREEDRAARETRLGSQADARQQLAQDRETRIASHQLSPGQSALMQADRVELAALQRKIATTEPYSGLLGTGWHSNTQQLADMQKRATELRQRLSLYGTDADTGDGTAPAAGPAAPAAAPVPAGRIRVKDSSGRIGSIPASQRDDALAGGYTEVE